MDRCICCGRELDYEGTLVCWACAKHAAIPAIFNVTFEEDNGESKSQKEKSEVSAIAE